MDCLTRIVFAWDKSSATVPDQPPYGHLPGYHDYFNTWVQSIHNGGTFFNGNVYHVEFGDERMLRSCRASSGGTSWNFVQPFEPNEDAITNGMLTSEGNALYIHTMPDVPPQTQPGENVLTIVVQDEAHDSYTHPVSSSAQCNPPISPVSDDWETDHAGLVASYQSHTSPTSLGKSRCVIFMIPTNPSAGCSYMTHTAINLWAAYSCPPLSLTPNALHGLTVADIPYCPCAGVDFFALGNPTNNPYCPDYGDLQSHGVVLSIDYQLEAFTSIGKTVMEYFCPFPPSSPPPSPPSPPPPPPSLIDHPRECECECSLPPLENLNYPTGCFVHLVPSVGYPPPLHGTASSKCLCHYYRLSKLSGAIEIYNHLTGMYVSGSPTWIAYDPGSFCNREYAITQTAPGVYELEFTTSPCALPPSPPSPPPSTVDPDTDTVALSQLIDSLRSIGVEVHRENGSTRAIRPNCSTIESLYDEGRCCR